MEYWLFSRENLLLVQYAVYVALVLHKSDNFLVFSNNFLFSNKS
jgi:hypothetical protein